MAAKARSTLAAVYPSLSQLDQASEESIFAWFWRCLRAVASGDELARRHRRGEYAYLKLYGTVENNTFTPFAQMRFPVEQGVVAELIDLLTRSGNAADPAFDATTFFQGAPAGIALDGTFRKISAAVKKKRGVLSGDDLRDLPEMLAKLYTPRAPSTTAANASSADASTTRLPATAPTAREVRGAPKLMLRLRRMNAELLRANERIAQLEAENAALRAENTELRTENRELRAENRRLSGVKRQLEGDLEESEGGLQEAHKEAADLKAQLEGARRARAAVARQLDAMIAERDRMQHLLTAAERRFEKAQAALDRERGRVDAARDAATKAREHEAEVERDAAAQVAAAQRLATDAINEAVEARILERGLMTMPQFVDYSAVEAAVGMVSPSFRQVAANVMAAECREADATTTLPPTNASGKGRGVVYMRVVKAMKPSNELSRRQLWERTQHLRASLTQVRAQRFRIAPLPCPPPPLPPPYRLECPRTAGERG